MSEILNKSYVVSHTLEDGHKIQLLDLFKGQSWLKERTLDDIKIMEDRCVIFGLIEKSTNKLVGFTRVLTDGLKYAYIHDVIVAEELQGKGLGRYLIETIIEHPTFKKIVCFEVLCLPDKIPFYNKFK